MYFTCILDKEKDYFLKYVREKNGYNQAINKFRQVMRYFVAKSFSC